MITISMSQIAHIFSRHTNYNAIRIGHISRINLPRTAVVFIATPCQDPSCTGTGRFTNVPGTGSCGINVDLVRQSSLIDHMAENSFRHWRTTDITQANK
jgi:hypothetical protein